MLDNISRTTSGRGLSAVAVASLVIGALVATAVRRLAFQRAQRHSHF